VFLLVTASARRAGGRGSLGSSRRPAGRCAWCPRRAAPAPMGSRTVRRAPATGGG